MTAEWEHTSGEDDDGCLSCFEENEMEGTCCQEAWWTGKASDTDEEGQPFCGTCGHSIIRPSP